MRRALLALPLSLFFAGCSSTTGNTNNTATLQEACVSLAGTVCNRFFACDSVAATAAFGSASNCASQAEAQASCSSAVCPAGTTYSSSQAQKCLNDSNALPCSAFMTGTTPSPPASCNTVCQ